MKATEFCYWLQGFFEIGGEVPKEGLSKPQVEMIKRHLHLVFKHEIDQSYPNGAELNEIHSPAPAKVTTHQQWDGPTILRC